MFELAIALDMGGIFEVGQELELASVLVAGLQDDEPGQQVLALEHRASEPDQLLVEAGGSSPAAMIARIWLCCGE